MLYISTLKRLMLLVKSRVFPISSLMGNSKIRLKSGSTNYRPTKLVRKKRQTHNRILKQAARQQSVYQRMSWRDYQNSLNQARDTHRRLKRVTMSLILVLIVLGTSYAVLPRIIKNWSTKRYTVAPEPSPSKTSQKIKPTETIQPKPKILPLANNQELLNLTQEKIEIVQAGKHFKLETSLDPTLQTVLIDSFDKVNSRYIGIVAMDPNTGRILAFAGFNKTPEKINPCTTNKFPAASIFKIVTAAAAAEKYGYTGDTLMKFNGYKHTLYKNQLKDRDNRYTNRISFRNSFAQSVNPVFGKIGALRLGKRELEKYGKAFGFNSKLDTDISVSPSHLIIAEDTYNHAEIASGFNRDTTLSPVHAAMIVSTALNNGQMVTPSIIDRIVDQKGQIVYNGSNPAFTRIISSNTSSIICSMMEATVKSGTARKAFRGYNRDKVLKKLVIGGKTGSIFNKAHDARFDWFVGFAKTEDRSENVVISVVVAHEEYIGRRAGEYARLAFKTHFTNYFAKEEAKRRLEDKS
jgi:peptidoglycan glycosyltransferase